MSERTILQSFAINNEGKVVSIRDVQRGKACDCACPACGEVLVAKQGDVRAWHFAHESGSDCDGAAETALHMAAKGVVVAAPWILAPELKVEGFYPNAREAKTTALVIRPAEPLLIEDAKLEVPWQTSIGKITPDVVVVSGGEKVFVEIVVTHRVDEEKRKKIEALGISTMEIELDLMLREEWGWDDLKNAVLENIVNRHWVYHRDTKFMRREADQLAMQKYQEKDIQRKSETTTKTVQNEARLTLSAVPVRIRQYTWGVTLWSGFDLATNEIMKSTARRFGARWNPRFKSWSYAPGLFEALVAYLETLGATSE